VLGEMGNRKIRLTISSPSVGQVFRKYENFYVAQLYGPSPPVAKIILPFYRVLCNGETIWEFMEHTIYETQLFFVS
jgi:hypothetical protein